MAQYTIPLILPADFSAENFIISDCNHDAVRWVESWPQWPAHALLLVGAAGSGKSHLGHLWAQRAQAGTLHARELGGRAPVDGHWLIEDIDQLTDERALFHWFNHSRETGHSLLLTSALAAAQLPFTLRDLTSRLLAVPVATIHDADDAALAAVMRKQFADRQIKIDDGVIAYIIPRMERSFARAKALVEWLDRNALQAQRTLTIPFVKQLLDAETPHAQP